MNDRPEDNFWSHVRFKPTMVCKKDRSATRTLLRYLPGDRVLSNTRRMWRKAVPAHLGRTASAVLTVGCGKCTDQDETLPALNSE